MWGIVTYRDAFKHTQQVKFAFVVHWIPLIAGKDKDRRAQAKEFRFHLHVPP
jgi:hypothetical protein